MLINPISFKALLYREVIRFVKVMQQTILSPLIASTLYIAVFGFTIGSQIHDINGMTYLQFIIPGIAIMDVIMSAYSNTSSSLFISKYLNLMDNLLIAPISYTELVITYILGGLVRGVLIGLLILAIGCVFTKVFVLHWFAFAFFLVTVSIIFAAFGLVTGLISDEFEHLTVFSAYLITPLSFFGGAFYSIKAAHPLIQTITLFNPFFYIIDGFRWSMLGYSEGNILISVLFCLIAAIFGVFFNIYLFKTGYKLKQ